MAVRGARADVRPVPWEVPVAAGGCWLALAVLLFPCGQGAAGWLFGGGFVWPRGSGSLLRSVTGLLSGRPGRGLAGGGPGGLPGAPVVYVVIGLGEVLLAAGSVWLIVCWWRRLGPGAPRGMADRAEAEMVLGVSNLRRKRAVIRPDLRAGRAGTIGGGES